MSVSGNKIVDDEPPGKVRKKNSDEKERKGKRQIKEDEEVYCICRRPHEGKFMIECDSCNEWYHGTCVNITQEESKHIDKYNCNGCCMKNDSLERIIYKARYIKELKKQQALATVHCGNCINCFQSEDCGCCMTCEIGEPCLKRRCVQAEVLLKAQEGHHAPRQKKERLMSDDFSPPPQGSSSTSSGVEVKKSRGRKKGQTNEKNGHTTLGKKHSDSSSRRMKGIDGEYESPSKMDAMNMKSYYEQELAASTYQAHIRSQRHSGRRKTVPKKADPLQCIGPNCVYAARPESKYCSDECGMSLARLRLQRSLYPKLEDYYKEKPHSLVRKEAEETRITGELAEYATKEKKLLEYQRVLENYVNKIKDFEPFSGIDDSDLGDSENVHCAVCALEYPAKSIAKHTIHCFMKFERQTSFGTALKMPINPSNLFCEEFNKVNNTYCKRLRVICAEHFKHEIENQLKVCGYPKAWMQTDSATPDGLFEMGEAGLIKGGYCDTDRKKCLQHHRWVQAMLATLETDRLYVLTKMDELLEKRKSIFTYGCPDLLSVMFNQRHIAVDEDIKKENATIVDESKPIKMEE